MLYGDSAHIGSRPNLSWHVEDAPELEPASTEGEGEDGTPDHDEYCGRPCWLVLSAPEGAREGQELMVRRGWPPGAAGPGLPALSLSRLEANAGRAELRRLAPECGGGTALPSAPAAPWAPELAVRHPASDGRLRLGVSKRHGAGVFAGRPLARGEAVEVAPALAVDSSEVPSYGSTCGELQHALSDYTFDGRLQGDSIRCLPLGFGGLYNHSGCPCIERRWAFAEPGADELHPLMFSFAFVALRDVAEGEELLLDYGADYWDARGLYPC
mmetsp:Transcript_4626/g.14989  ORF Transcript_4626/g.14989 Transcript_4626/m.14989 type:complete len:270 (-) Transcript_4626:114-923(-)